MGDINGITFSNQLITSANMAHYMWTFLNKTNGVTKGCGVSYSGNNINIAAGYFIVFGRMVQLIGTTTVASPTVASGQLYCKLVFTIDLTRENTTEVFNQGFFQVLSNASAYPNPTQQDLDGTGTKYQLPFCQFVKSANGISAFRDLRPILNLSNVYATMKNNLDSVRAQYDAYFAEKEAEVEQMIADLESEDFLKKAEARRAINIVLRKDDWVARSDGYGWHQTISQDANGNALPITSADWPIIMKGTNVANTPMATIKTQRKNFSYITMVTTGNGEMDFTCRETKPTIDFYVRVKGV